MLLTLFDLVFKCRLDLQICKGTRRNKFKVQTSKLFMKGRLSFLNHQIIAIRFPTQRVSNDICFAGLIIDAQIIILDQLQPSSLSEIQLWLSEQVLKTLMI